MNIYILAFSNDNTGRNGYYTFCRLQDNYDFIRINNNTIVIFVSPNCNLNLPNLITQIKTQYNVQGPKNVYLLVPDGHPLNPICGNYDVIRVGSAGTFLTDYVYQVLNGNNVQSIRNRVANIPPIVFDPLIIIFTEQITDRTGKIEGYDEWLKAINIKADFYNNKFKKFSPKNKQDKGKIRIAEFKVDNNYTVLFVKENDYVGDKKKKNKTKNGINNLLSRILKKWGKNVGKNIYVAVHALSNYAKDKDVDGFKKEFNSKVAYICDFHHIDEYKEFTDALIKFLDLINKNNTREAIKKCEEIKKLIEKFSKQTIKNFSLLKHRIAHLFLPLDIDLQGIYEVSKQSKDEAVKYLKEVLENKNKNPTFYRQKLADLQFMVAKVKGVGGTSLTENDLPDNKSILDLLPDLLPEDKTIVKEEWEMLLKLSGLGLKENKNNLFNKEDLEVKVDSGIFVFMKLLDDKIGKYCKDEKSININDVNEILDAEPLKKLLEEIGFHSFSLNPFSHWYNFLNSYLDKLREKIVKEEEK
jgi:hypothetical protein